MSAERSTVIQCCVVAEGVVEYGTVEARAESGRSAAVVDGHEGLTGVAISISTLLGPSTYATVCPQGFSASAT